MSYGALPRASETWFFISGDKGTSMCLSVWLDYDVSIMLICFMEWLVENKMAILPVY